MQVYGGLVRLTGKAAPNTTVTLQRWDLTRGWVTLATVTSNATGGYLADAKITTTWFVRALTDGAISVPRVYRQKTLVTLTSNTTTVAKNVYAALSGVVRPAYPGKRVAIQQLVSGAWKTIANVTLNSGSAFSYRWRSSKAGTFQFRVQIGAQEDSLANNSSTRRIVVR